MNEIYLENGKNEWYPKARFPRLQNKVKKPTMNLGMCTQLSKLLLKTLALCKYSDSLLLVYWKNLSRFRLQ